MERKNLPRESSKWGRKKGYQRSDPNPVRTRYQESKKGLPAWGHRTHILGVFSLMSCLRRCRAPSHPELSSFTLNVGFGMPNDPTTIKSRCLTCFAKYHLSVSSCLTRCPKFPITNHPLVLTCGSASGNSHRRRLAPVFVARDAPRCRPASRLLHR